MITCYTPITAYDNILHPISASACNDQRNDCFKLASGGFCKKQQKAMEKLCPRSCNVCPDGKKKVEESVSSVTYLY